MKIGDRVILTEANPDVYSVAEIYEVSGLFLGRLTYHVYLLYSNHYHDLIPYQSTYSTHGHRLRLATIREIVNLRPTGTIYTM